ncbi:VOC family protein [Amycolatopsis sp. NPDC051371]|uniref:VOC family protein n=1 Tax=Amycolatopsis sp. NPDC051371 TaxID=3155800 RepID=UPI003420DC96
MSVELFAGIAVRDFPGALAWYERLFGSPPTFVVHETEVLWQVAEHGSVYVVLRPERAGLAMHTLFVEDLDERVAGISARGIEPVDRETYDNGVRKIIYRDPEGNELGIGGPPA